MARRGRGLASAPEAHAKHARAYVQGVAENVREAVREARHGNCEQAIREYLTATYYRGQAAAHDGAIGTQRGRSEMRRIVIADRLLHHADDAVFACVRKKMR